MSTWISSDWHLGHKNIVLGQTDWEGEDRRSACRKFNTVEEHDEVILKNINDNVNKNDFIYFLGDFSFGGSDNIYKYRSLINCENIHFVFGNHDYHIKKNKVVKTPKGYINSQNLFLSCSDILEKKIGKDNLVFCHYPMRTWHKGRNAIMLFGHCHGNLKQEYFNNFKTMDVGIDTHNEFRPYHIDEIRQIMKNKDNYEHFTDTIQ